VTGRFAARSLAVPEIVALDPYQPGKPLSELERELGIDDAVKLASNENPLGPSPKGLAAAQAALADCGRYPDGGGFHLKRALAAHHNLDPACITLGNGSNDVLVLLAQAFLNPGREAVYSAHCFAVYPLAVQAAGGIARVAPALADDHPLMPLGHDLEALAAAVTPATRLLFIANPNNPTGTWLAPAALESFIAALPGHVVVVIDEAYFEYHQALHGAGAANAARWLGRYPNLVVTRTFSKVYGLAGLRIGYALSDPALADLINRIRQPFNVNSAALAAAEAALADTAFIDRSLKVNREGLERLADALPKRGYRVYPTAGNFVLVDTGGLAEPLYQALLHRGVITRRVGNYGLPNHLRITVGSAAEIDRLLAALDDPFMNHPG